MTARLRAVAALLLCVGLVVPANARASNATLFSRANDAAALAGAALPQALPPLQALLASVAQTAAVRGGLASRLARAPVNIAVTAPTPSDYCVSSNFAGWAPGQAEGYVCYMPDPGASFSFTVVTSPAAQAPPPGVGGGSYSCGTTAFAVSYTSGSHADPTLSVSFSGGSGRDPSQGGTCGEPSVVTTTVTRTAASSQGTVAFKVDGPHLLCMPPLQNCTSSSVEASIYVEVRNPPPPIPPPPPGTNTPPTQPERPCGRCNGTTIGDPVDVATGELWAEKNDLTLSGPFGLWFTRFYGSQTAGSRDLGGGNWTHNYAARLDVSNAFSGAVAYVDYQGMPYYFSGVTRGAASYDSNTGMTLALSSDGSAYTLTTFDGRQLTFNAKGELTSLRDRPGNTQTVARDATAGHNDRIVSVSDALGRKLCMFYDGANRIAAVAGWLQTAPCPSTAPASSATTPVVTMAYETGGACPATYLCAVTEADGGRWSYQYSDSAKPSNLTKVLDPLGNPEQTNTYSGNKVVHHESGLCSTSPCAETGNYLNITYPTSGSTVTITDGLNRTSTITYDPSSLLLTNITGPVCHCGGDQTRSYTYDAYGRVLTATDNGVDGSTKHVISYGYGRDAGGRAYPGPTSAVENLDTSGTTRTATFVYYPVGDPRQDLVQTSTIPSVDQPGLSVTTTDTYSSGGLLTQSATSGYVNGVATTYGRSWTYDARGRLLTQTGPRTDVLQRTTYAYFSDTDSDAARAGQPQSITDALGHVTIIAGAAGYTSFTPFGDPQSITDPNGVMVQYTYDARGRQLSAAIPAEEGIVPTYRTSYDSAGRPVQRIRPSGNGMKAVYDTSGRLNQVIRLDSSSAMRERVLVGYDAFDEPVSAAAQACSSPAQSCGAWTTAFSTGYTYASTSNLARITNADGTYKSMTYTAQGQLLGSNDENHVAGSNSTYSYDLAGRRLAGTRLLAGVPVTTRYAYDLHDNLVAVTDPNGNVTSYRYDDFYRVIRETSPVSGVTTYAYDAADNLVSTTNANGTVSTLTYDALDRTLSETDTKGSANASEAWTYDDTGAGHYGIGRLATMTDPSGSTAFTYDLRGKVSVESHNVAGHTFTYGYGYDVNENRSAITYPDGTIVSYTFDFADRPYSASQVLPAGPLALTRRVATLAQLRAKGLPAPPHAAKSELSASSLPGARRIITLPNGRATTSVHGPEAPLARSLGVAARTGPTRGISSRADSVLVSSATYAPFGPMTATAFGNGTTQSMTYNQRYLPQENKLTANGVTVADHVYSEDPAGNITAISDAVDAGYARTFGYDDLNRLTTANSGSKLWGTATGNGYTYDAMGNMLTARLGSSRTMSMSYRAGAAGSSGLPLLTTVVQNGTSYPISYDAIGSELGDTLKTFTYGARELLGSALPGFSSYAFDGFRRRVQTQTPDTLQRASFYDVDNHLLAESETAAAPAAIAYDYVWFGDRPVAQLTASGTAWSFADHLGTPLIQTDATGAISWQDEHEPYGLVMVSRAGDLHQPLRFPGQEAQQFDTGANGAMPVSYNGARWYRPRWGRYTQTDPIEIGATSPYTYANANPISFIDPDGAYAKLPYNDPECVSLRKRIQNLFDTIRERTGQLHEDELKLPERAPNDTVKPSLSRWGHRMLINKDKADLARARARYDAKCDDPGGPLSCPAVLPVRARATTSVDKFQSQQQNWWDRIWWIVTTAPKVGPVPVPVP